MLYLVFGENFEKAREKSKDLLETLKKKKPEAAVFEAEADNFDENKFEEWIGGQGLFEGKFIVVCKRIFENAEAKEWVLRNLEKISGSDNFFLFLEKKVLKDAVFKIQKAGGKVQEFITSGKGRNFALEGGKSFPSEEFNVFSLAEAFGKRDKKSLWVLFEKAQKRDIPAEEICGILFWQLKSVFLSENAKTPAEAGLKPFVFFKAKSFAKNYKPEEIKNLSAGLISAYHESHRGLYDFNSALERFILSI